MAAAPDAGWAVEPRAADGTRRLRTAWVRRPGSGLGRHRGGPAAVGDLRDPSHGGRGHAGCGRRRLPGGVHPALRHAAVHRRRVPAPARGRRSGARQMISLELFFALVMLAALVAYALLGCADFGGGIWDLLSGGPRAAE